MVLPETTDKETKKDEGKIGLDISKIKYSEKTVEIHYLKYCKDGAQKETIYKSNDMPHIDFFNAKDALLPEVLFLLELPEEYSANLEIRGVSLGTGAVITAVKKFPNLGNKAFCINTPFLEFESKEGVEPLPKRTALAVEKFEKEALEYIKGKRKYEQKNLKLIVNS